MFFKICEEVLNRHAPRKKKCIRGNESPFMIEALSKEIMKRTKLRNNFPKNRAEENNKNTTTRKLLFIIIKKKKTILIVLTRRTFLKGGNFGKILNQCSSIKVSRMET